MTTEEISSLAEQINSLDPSSRRSLRQSLVATMDGREREGLLRTILEGLPDEDSIETVLGGVRSLNPNARIALVTQSAARLTRDEQRAVVRGLEGLTPPGDTKALWTIVVAAFAFVLVGSFGFMAIGIFLKPQDGAVVKPELVLSMFTSVVGFLAGLFIPSPNNRRGAGG